MGRVMDLYEAGHAGRLRPAEPFRLFGLDEYPDLRRHKYELDCESRSCFIFDVSGSIRKTVTPRSGSRLVFDVAADFPQNGHANDSVQLEVHAESGSASSVLYACAWERAYPRHRRWVHADVDLSDSAGRELTLRFDVSLHKNGDDSRGGICLLGDPRLDAPEPAKRPNVILVVLETLRRDHLSLHGYPRKTSPFLEKLAEEAIVFDNAYSQSNWTRPSVATILTGLYPSEHRAITALDKLDDSFTLLPEVLRQHGYLTAAFCTGRVISDPIFNYDQGFDLFVDEGKALFDTLRQSALAWLDANRRQPFFIYLHTFDPHAPYLAPGRLAELFDSEYDGRLKELKVLKPMILRTMGTLSERDREYVRARYDAEILYTDMVLERLIHDLEKRGLWDNTLLVVTSDHGEEFYEHGNWGHGVGLFPEQLRVPLLIRLAGQEHGGMRPGGLASGVDIMPTILCSLGLPVPDAVAGIDLLATLDENGRTGRDHHYAQFRATRFFEDPAPTCQVTRSECSLIGQRLQYIWTQHELPPRKRAQRLFDLSQDPFALNDIASSRPDIVKEHVRAIDIRYATGYTIAAVAADARRRTYAGTVRSGSPIVRAKGIDTESDDVVALSDDRKVLRFELKVSGDDDLVRFETRPANVAVTIDIECDGAAVAPESVRLGPKGKPAEKMPVEVPAGWCLVDAPLGRVPPYSAGDRGAIYIWRRGTPRTPSDSRVVPGEEALETLKDLGYL